MASAKRYVLMTLPVVGAIAAPLIFGFPIVSKDYCPGSAQFSCPGHVLNPDANWIFWGALILLLAVLFLYDLAIAEPSAISARESGNDGS